VSRRYVARYVDKIIRPRWFYLTAPPFSTVIAGLCVLLGLIMLPLEYVPLTSSIPAFPVAAFGLALTTRDGLFVIVGLASILAGIFAFLMVGTSHSVRGGACCLTRLGAHAPRPGGRLPGGRCGACGLPARRCGWR
jgi:hypothetical protein